MKDLCLISQELYSLIEASTEVASFYWNVKWMSISDLNLGPVIE